MSKMKERLLKKQAEREAKIKEQIKIGKARRIVYEERKKKPERFSLYLEDRSFF